MTQKLFTKNFVLLILGQITSLFANLILKLALSMYVLEVTGSAAIFAGILSAATIPTILLSPLGGILADRANRKNIMVALDTLTGISVLSAALLLSESNALAVISILLVILSILGAFETPTVQACIPTMLQGDNITRGNAVVNQAASLSYLTAPMLGGVLYTMFHLKPVMYASVTCFFITALFECFIKLSYQRSQDKDNVRSIVKQDSEKNRGFEAHDKNGVQLIVKQDSEKKRKFKSHGKDSIPLIVKQDSKKKRKFEAHGKDSILSIVKQDFLSSMKYISKEQANISKMLLFTAFSRFFVMGITIVGLPYIVHTILGLNAKYYGFAESTLAIATILGSIAAGLLTKKLKIHRLSILLTSMGGFIIPVGIAFLCPVSPIIKYMITVISLCGMQIAISIFSIFAVSLIQQRTPNHFIGKVMAYTSTITLCVQPIGQIVYGFLFDRFSNAIYLVLLPTGIIVCIVGLSTIEFFKNMEVVSKMTAEGLSTPDA